MIRRTLAVMVLMAACGLPSALRLPEGEPYVSGPIEAITHRATASMSLLVRAGPGSREPCGISATVDAETRILQRSRSGELRSASRANLGLGDTVHVYVDGPVAESCPVQGRASVVVISSRAAVQHSQPFSPATRKLRKAAGAPSRRRSERYALLLQQGRSPPRGRDGR